MPSPPQILRHGHNLGALEQCDRVTPWFQGTFGFRSVTTEVPQRFPVSHLMRSKDSRVTTETGNRSTHVSDTHSCVFSFEAEKVKYMVCWDLEHIDHDLREKKWLGKAYAEMYTLSFLIRYSL